MRVCQRLKRVIVTPAVYRRFLNFFTLIFRALGTHCHDLGHDSRMTSCSEIECAQLHSELFRRRHSTRQSHGLFALAKHLLFFGRSFAADPTSGAYDTSRLRRDTLSPFSTQLTPSMSQSRFVPPSHQILATSLIRGVSSCFRSNTRSSPLRYDTQNFIGEKLTSTQLYRMADDQELVDVIDYY